MIKSFPTYFGRVGELRSSPSEVSRDLIKLDNTLQSIVHFLQKIMNVDFYKIFL